MRIGFAYRSITRLREIPRGEWDREEGQHFLFMRCFFPNVVSTVHYRQGTASFGQIVPGPTPDRTRIVELYLRKAKPGEPEDRAKELDEYIRQSNAILRDEDFATGLATQKGLGSRAPAGLHYGHNERGSQYFHEWVDWYLSSDPTRPEPVL